MSKPPSLGRHNIDLPKLLETRLLVQAQSGGGKSWLLRRLLEQTAPHVQQLVLDPEGEFHTLREKFDYIVCAPHDADAIATPQTATLLARRLWESGTSAVLNIYDLKAHERRLFVRRFLEALVDAPKKLWHPTIVVLDEAHVYAPQTGRAESLGAVIDIATRGRKRGLCLIPATQRLSKLHKDVAAEMMNKLIGRAGMDVDVARAADELGMTKRQAMGALRDLKPGEFYAFGPALCHGVEKTVVGPVKTTHPKAGQRLLEAPPPPSKAVLKKLSELSDLEKEAEQEARTVDELRAQATDLKRRLTLAEKRAEQAGIPEKEVQRRENAAYQRGAAEGSDKALLDPDVPAHLKNIVGEAQAALKAIGPMNISRSKKSRETDTNIARAAIAATSSAGISASQQKILNVLAQLEAFGLDTPDKKMVAAHAGFSPTSGGYANNLGKLRSAGMIDYPDRGHVALTETGRETATPPDKAPTLDDLHRSWLSLMSSSQAAITEHLIALYPDPIEKSELAEALGFSPTSGGYANNLGKLRTLGAVEYPRRGEVRASSTLFPARQERGL